MGAVKEPALSFEEELRWLHHGEAFMTVGAQYQCFTCHVPTPCPTIQLLDKHVAERHEVLMGTDWGDRWDSLEPAPDLVPKENDA